MNQRRTNSVEKSIRLIIASLCVLLSASVAGVVIQTYRLGSSRRQLDEYRIQLEAAREQQHLLTATIEQCQSTIDQCQSTIDQCSETVGRTSEILSKTSNSTKQLREQIREIRESYETMERCLRDYYNNHNYRSSNNIEVGE